MSSRLLRHYDREEIKTLPPFAALPLSAITMVNADSLPAALAALAAARLVGFDTESRPTFHKGEESDGPHLIQLATLEHAYLFAVSDEAVMAGLRPLLASGQLQLVGFDLRSDRQHLWHKLGLSLEHVVDIGRLFRQMGEQLTVGAVQAVARVFGQQFRKSRKLSTSNWSRLPLSDAQLLYAANDAWVALRVYQQLNAKKPRT